MARGKNSMVQLLKLSDYGRGRVKDALAGLFRTVLADLEVTPMEWERRVNKYLDTVEKENQSGSSRSTLKGNITKEFSKDEIAWKVFCKTFLVLGMDRVVLEIELKRLDEVSIHSYDGINRNKDAGEILALIFKRIRLDLGIGPDNWILLMDTFLKAPELGLPDRGGERSAVKSKVEKDLGTDTMTWKMFLRGMRFLGVHEMALKVICFRDGEETSHRILIRNVCNRVSFRKRFEEVVKQRKERLEKLRQPIVKSTEEQQ
tara:strand:+ start:206807 stop:207586 length:780 start_codon:yes stop_codon:yes gene_type:complete